MTITYLVHACPLCGGCEHQMHAAPLPNLYSEKLAALLQIEEAELLAKMVNVQCLHCTLIYKRNWFAGALLEKLFCESVPSHPKGWDVVSGRFTSANFQNEVREYAQAVTAQQHDQINRYRRALTSILVSIPELDDTAELPDLLQAVEQGDIDRLRDADSLLSRIMGIPRPYSRFSGFSAPALWSYIKHKLAPFESYAEIGCPLWGLLTTAQQQGLQVAYFKHREPNYWSDGCRSASAEHCSQYLSSHYSVPLLDWQTDSSDHYDVIGAFQYLDHLEKPMLFVQTLFERARSAVIILDSVDQPVAIQHFTGWTAAAIQWLANHLACKLYDDFNEIESSGNRLYLLSKV